MTFMNSYQKLLDIYKSQDGVAEALGITQPGVSQWGSVIPIGRAKAISDLTGGEISIAEIVEDYERARDK